MYLKKIRLKVEEFWKYLGSCVQKGLFCVFERMVEEVKMNEETFVVRLLVVSTQVGCLLGKSSGVIKQMASESREQIRILPRDKLPACASSSDELVQVSLFLNQDLSKNPC